MTARIRRVIAVYEILSFIATLVNVMFTLALVESLPLILYGIAVVVILLATVSLVAGVWLWQDRPRARILSLAVQIAQVPQLMVGGIVGYGVGLGLAIVVGVGEKPMGMKQPVHFVLTAGSGADGYYLGINVLALTALVLLMRWQVQKPVTAELPTQ